MMYVKLDTWYQSIRSLTPDSRTLLCDWKYLSLSQVAASQSIFWSLDGVNCGALRVCVSQGLTLAREHDELGKLLGHPLTYGPWYNSSIGFSHDSNIANCKFRVDGTCCSSDVVVRVSVTHQAACC